MNPAVLKLLCCPRCHAAALTATAGGGNDIVDGAVRCADCGQEYPVAQGILDLLWGPSPAAREEVAAQPREDAQWWEDFPGRLRPLLEGETGRAILLSAPRCPYPELAEAVESYRRLDALADDYYELLEWLDLNGGETVAEVGADSCWGARDLARRARTVVATDVAGHLEMGQAYLDEGAHFDRVRCDMVRFPFRETSLDLVFGVATIHHAADLEELFQAIRRALKPGGRAVFFDEPVRGRSDHGAQETFGAARRALGFQEHIYTIDEYFEAARAAGFRPHVVPMTSLLRDPTRKWPLARRAGLALIRAGLGRRAPFTRHVYPWLLRFYPRIPFPRFALVLVRR